jgi:hypothetical protein
LTAAACLLASHAAQQPACFASTQQHHPLMDGCLGGVCVCVCVQGSLLKDAKRRTVEAQMEILRRRIAQQEAKRKALAAGAQPAAAPAAAPGAAEVAAPTALEVSHQEQQQGQEDVMQESLPALEPQEAKLPAAAAADDGAVAAPHTSVDDPGIEAAADGAAGSLAGVASDK